MNVPADPEPPVDPDPSAPAAPPDPPPPRAFELDPETPRHPPAPPPKKATSPGRPRRGEKEPPKKKGKWVLFVVVNLLAIGIAVFWFTRPEDVKRRFLEQIPEGAGRRAITAGIALVAMVVLARVVLPGARMAILHLSEAGRWFRRQPRGKRLLLLPAQAGLEFVWLGAQALFAIDAIAILLSGVAFLLYAIKIAKPDLFPFLP